jgi:hypothetical protein
MNKICETCKQPIYDQEESKYEESVNFSFHLPCYVAWLIYVGKIHDIHRRLIEEEFSNDQKKNRPTKSDGLFISDGT